LVDLGIIYCKIIAMNDIELGFREAKKITKHFAKTFYLASLFLPKKKREASHAVYAICRISDETVDNPSGKPSLGDLEKIRNNIDLAYSNAAPENKLLLAFQETVKRYGIPKEYFYGLLEGMHMDLVKTRYNSFEELEIYCYRVAGVVGLIMLRVFGCEDEKAKQFASDLGIAMQMTNILRDVKEDYQRGRIYIPADTLEKFKVSENEFSRQAINSNFKSMLQYLIEKTKQYYLNSEAGIKLIRNRRSRFVVMAMKEMYFGILAG